MPNYWTQKWRNYIVNSPRRSQISKNRCLKSFPYFVILLNVGQLCNILPWAETVSSVFYDYLYSWLRIAEGRRAYVTCVCYSLRPQETWKSQFSLEDTFMFHTRYCWSPVQQFHCFPSCSSPGPGAHRTATVSHTHTKPLTSIQQLFSLHTVSSTN